MTLFILVKESAIKSPFVAVMTLYVMASVVYLLVDVLIFAGVGATAVTMMKVTVSLTRQTLYEST